MEKLRSADTLAATLPVALLAAVLSSTAEALSVAGSGLFLPRDQATALAVADLDGEVEATALAVADFDGDVDLDIAAANGTRSVAILPGDGAGGFARGLM